MINKISERLYRDVLKFLEKNTNKDILDEIDFLVSEEPKRIDILFSSIHIGDRMIPIDHNFTKFYLIYICYLIQNMGYRLVRTIIDMTYDNPIIRLTLIYKKNEKTITIFCMDKMWRLKDISEQSI